MIAAMRARLAALALVAAASLAPAAAAACRYDVAFDGPAGGRLAVDVACADTAFGGLAAMHRAAGGHVLAVKDADGSAIEASGGAWRLAAPPGPSPGSTRRLRYRFDLAGLAETDSVTAALGRGDSVLALLPAWLLAPIGVDPSHELEIRFADDDGRRFVSGLPRRDGAHLIRAGQIRFAGYTAFGRMTGRTIRQPTGLEAGAADGAAVTTLEAVRLDRALSVSDDTLFTWTERSAAAVGRYFGGLPTGAALLVFAPRPGRGGVPFGRAVPGGGNSVVVEVGEAASAAQLYGDWVLIHELIHTTMPFMPDGFWFMEGSATYVEPIARARAGWRSQESVWQEFADHMPRGLRAMTGAGIGGGGGSATYWGGALLMLLADVRMREESAGRAGLEACFRAIRREIGDGVRRIRVARAVDACDRGVGGSVMRDLVDRHVAQGGPVDLDGLWARLGVVRAPDGVRLDDAAPLARIRDQIVWGLEGRPSAPLPTD